jgi:serine/threonine protein phosphatase 1
MEVKQISGERIFVIGDIHGCHPKLETILQLLFAEERFSEDDHLVFVGDYIDRGAKSKEVLDSLVVLKKCHPNVTFLRGNHEDMFLCYLCLGGRYGNCFRKNGGGETLRSYGFGESDISCDNIVQADFPEEHIEFLTSLDFIAESDKYVFVHGGLIPEVVLEEQDEGQVVWIREGWIDKEYDIGKTVVFGHTPVEYLAEYHDGFEFFGNVGFNLPYKIGIDGWPFMKNGHLNCVNLTEKKIISVNWKNSVDRYDFSDKVGFEIR